MLLRLSFGTKFVYNNSTLKFRQVSCQFHNTFGRSLLGLQQETKKTRVISLWLLSLSISQHTVIKTLTLSSFILKTKQKGLKWVKCMHLCGAYRSQETKKLYFWALYTPTGLKGLTLSRRNNTQITKLRYTLLVPGQRSITTFQKVLRKMNFKLHHLRKIIFFCFNEYMNTNIVIWYTNLYHTFQQSKSHYTVTSIAFCTKIYSYLSGTVEKSKHFAKHLIIRMNVDGWLLLI